MDIMDLSADLDTARANELESLITKARAAYYNDTPVVTDAEFDAWVDELRELRPASTAVTSIGAPLPSSTEWQKARHGFVMGSLDKVNTPEELAEWARSYNTLPPTRGIPPLFVTEKLDGISIHLRYDAGKLVQAITRGDGTTGEDITRNVLRMRGVRTEVRGFTGSLRGEVILRKSLHAEQFPDYANPRNAASGISKRYDGKGCEYLSVFLYQVIDGNFSTEAEQFEWLEKVGFQTPNWEVTSDPVGRWNVYQAVLRAGLDYDIDGLVVRVNSLNVQASLGDKDGRPRGAVAFKFAAAEEATTLRKIEWQVGGTGRLTPVAVFDPVNLVGVTVTNASVYNAAYIRTLGLTVGSRVLVIRANDVIPRVTKVLEKAEGPIVVPTVCPTCGGQVASEGEYLVCQDEATCPAQTVGRIKRYIAALDIKEWGDTLIERLVQAGLVRTPADLYKLSIEQLSSLERISEGVADKLLASLHEKDEQSLAALLGALSIPLCAGQTIQLVVEAGLDTWDKLRAVELIRLSSISGFGPVKAQALYGWLQGSGPSLVEALVAGGVRIKDKIVGTLTGKSFCFTGSMQRKRSDLEALVLQHGGSIKSSVGKGLTYLVIADPNSTSSKAQAARKHGTRCISEEDFLSMLRT